jgi:nicotinamidase-related amidase
MPTLQNCLLDVDDCVLVMIDVQKAFVDKLVIEQREPLVARVCWLLRVARLCKVPIVVTAEEYGEQPLVPALGHLLGDIAPVHDKRSFGLATQPDIVSDIRSSGRHAAVLIGLETDVCVAQSALGLLDMGVDVAVVADATGSPHDGHEYGLARMRDAGCAVLSAKALFYEWLRTVERVRRVHELDPSLRSDSPFRL